MKNRTKDEIIDEMVDVMPFELNVKIRPYIKEAMDIYLKQELSKLRQHDVSRELPSQKLCRKNQNYICRCVDDSRCNLF